MCSSDLTCAETWGSHKPLFHFSNGRDHALDKAHSDYVYDVHEELFFKNIDIDYEYKLKDYTINKFTESYPIYANYLRPITAVN